MLRCSGSFLCARAVGYADTPCVAAYAQSAYGRRPPRYVQAHTRGAFYFKTGTIVYIRFA